MFSTPAELEQALWSAARAVLPPEALRSKVLHRAIANRSRLYTTERAQLTEGADHPDGDLAARALFFTPADAAKIMTPLAELDAAGLLPPSTPLRVLDLGAGAGAMSLGLAAYLRRAGDDRAVEVRAIDRDGRALRIFAGAAAAYPSLDVETLAGDVDRPGWGEDYDLVLAGTVLNELEPGLQRNLVRRALSVVADHGAVICLEPALRETARALHEVRDWVLHDRLGHVFAPCTHACTPCPSLADERDWCHEDRNTRLPPRTAELARVTGLRTGGLKWSYLTLRRQPGALAGPDAIRVISQPRKLKGRREMTGCSERGLERVRLLKRNRSPSNRGVEDARRGDVLVSTGGADIGPEDRVDVLTVRPADR